MNDYQIDVYPLPSLAEPSQLQGAVAVVIDVLRATTVLTYATQSGVRGVMPVLDIETAHKLKTSYPPEEVLLGGERQGLPIDGFDLGNSPQHYTPARVAGKTLIFTTTNGTIAMHAAKPARSICIASFLNAAAVVECLQNEKSIAIICAGTNGKETEEDLLLAGCLTFRLRQRRNDSLNEAAERVVGLWQEPTDAAQLEQLFRKSTGGKTLCALGLEEDMTASAQLDTIDIVPKLSLGDIP
jgi:2-phosphosulfolactate phosphatase